MQPKFDASRFLSSTIHVNYASEIELERPLMEKWLADRNISRDYYTKMVENRVTEIVDMIANCGFDLKFNFEFDGREWSMVDVIDDIIDVFVRRFMRVNNVQSLFDRVYGFFGGFCRARDPATHKNRIVESNKHYAQNLKILTTSSIADIDRRLVPKKHSFGSTDVTIFNFIARPIDRHALMHLTRSDTSSCSYVYVVRAQSDGTVKIGSTQSSMCDVGVSRRFSKCGDYVNYDVLYLIRVDGLNPFRSPTKDGTNTDKKHTKSIEIVEIALKKLCGHMRDDSDNIVNDTKIGERLPAIDFTVLYEIQSNPSMVLDMIAKYSYGDMIEIIVVNGKCVGRELPKENIRARIGEIRTRPTVDIVNDVMKFIEFDADGVANITKSAAYRNYQKYCKSIGAKPKLRDEFDSTILTACFDCYIKRKHKYKLRQ